MTHDGLQFFEEKEVTHQMTTPGASECEVKGAGTSVRFRFWTKVEDLSSCCKSAILPRLMAYLFCSPSLSGPGKGQVRTQHATRVWSVWIRRWMDHSPPGSTDSKQDDRKQREMDKCWGGWLILHWIGLVEKKKPNRWKIWAHICAQYLYV